MRETINWAHLLAFVTGSSTRSLLQNEYLTAENRILRARLPSRLRLSDPEWFTLAEIGKRLERKGLKQVAFTAKPDKSCAVKRNVLDLVRIDANDGTGHDANVAKGFSTFSALLGISFGGSAED